MLDQLQRLLKWPALVELVGAGLAVYGLVQAAGAAAGWIAAGVALILKAADLERRRSQ